MATVSSTNPPQPVIVRAIKVVFLAGPVAVYLAFATAFYYFPKLVVTKFLPWVAQLVKAAGARCKQWFCTVIYPKLKAMFARMLDALDYILQIFIPRVLRVLERRWRFFCRIAARAWDKFKNLFNTMVVPVLKDIGRVAKAIILSTIRKVKLAIIWVKAQILVPVAQASVRFWYYCRDVVSTQLFNGFTLLVRHVLVPVAKGTERFFIMAYDHVLVPSGKGLRWSITKLWQGCSWLMSKLGVFITSLLKWLGRKIVWLFRNTMRGADWFTRRVVDPIAKGLVHIVKISGRAIVRSARATTRAVLSASGWLYRNVLVVIARHTVSAAKWFLETVLHRVLEPTGKRLVHIVKISGRAIVRSARATTRVVINTAGWLYRNILVVIARHTVSAAKWFLEAVLHPTYHMIATGATHCGRAIVRASKHTLDHAVLPIARVIALYGQAMSRQAGAVLKAVGSHGSHVLTVTIPASARWTQLNVILPVHRATVSFATTVAQTASSILNRK